MELLAPAGGYRALVAAVEAGADAVYAGGKMFSARRQAENLNEEEMKKAVEYCHLRDRKLYVTINTLIADQEMEAALGFIFFLQEIGVDGIIVQDLGLLRACHSVFPDLRLHASTQMTLHNQAGILWAREQGLKRVVLARELARDQVELIHQQVPEMELEMFAHGALCYSFSGQCLFSSLVGARSGNRGQCAQPCRLPYTLLDQTGAALDSRGPYLLSPADLCLLPFLSEMEAAGISSLKIEGRMKRAEYVATVTRIYREALDRKDELKPGEVEEYMRTLLAAFNRTFTTGYWQGPDAAWISPLRPNNRGTFLGRIQEVGDGKAVINLKDGLRQGDGIEVWTSSGNNAVTVVRHLWLQGRQVDNAPPGSRVQVEIAGVGVGDRVFKTSDTALIEQAQELTRENREPGRRRVAMTCRVHRGRPLYLSLRDLASGRTVEAMSGEEISPARRQPTTADEIRDKIGELGDTPFALDSLDIELDPGCLVPFSWIKDLRRRVTDQLKQELLRLTHPPAIKAADFARGVKKLEGSPSRGYGRQRSEQPRGPLLTVNTNTVARAEAALGAGADVVYLQLAGVRGKRITATDCERLLRAKGQDQRVLAALPRILLPGEELEYDPMLWDGILISNPGWLIRRSAGLRHGDYPLNVFNRYSVSDLLKRGLDMVCLSLELNLRQVTAMAQTFPGRLECVVHGDVPLMVSRFCQMGNQNRAASCQECSAPCVRQSYQLQDRKGYRFPLLTDRYGRFYLYNSRTLCAIEEMASLARAGIGAVRLEMHLAEPDAIAETVGIYRQVVDQPERSPDQFRLLKDRLREASVSDFSKLHYYRGVV